MARNIIITCVNWGNYCGRGVEYVNNLFDMIGRNTSEQIAFEFVCFTDDPEGLHPRIQARPLPGDMTGWWNKLYLFKHGHFPKDTQIFFFDLDVAITGNISDILAYEGDFALIRDFYHPDRISNAVMSWKADNNYIYDSWQYTEFSELGTDQTFMEKIFEGKKPDIFQEMFKGKVVSYKVDCQHGIPQHARIVCFHGLPRPHEAGGWVDRIWKVGGDSVADYILHCNTDDDTLYKQIDINAERDLEVVSWVNPHEKTVLLIGGGPSLGLDLPLIQFYASQGAEIFAINGALDYLIERGIKVDGHIMLDARPENIGFVQQKYDTTYYLASQVHPDVFEYLHENNVKLFHPNIPGLYEKLAGKKSGALVGGGRTAGLMAMGLVYALGYRAIHLFGYDSSYNTDNHAYKQGLNTSDRIVEVEYAGVKYKSTPWMVQQADDFIPLAQVLVSYGCEISVHGNGLLPAIANSMQVTETEKDEAYGI